MNIKEVGLGCTGCSACLASCPVHAISMKENDEGFLYPEVDFTKCTNCGLCLSVCPVNNSKYENIETPECYAAMASDEIRRGSSSGGLFPILAYECLVGGGAIAGAVWQGERVVHIVSDKKEDIEKMRNSKYLQSSVESCYVDVQALLNTGKNVLFTGTPCQVAGLYAFLKKPYENLTTVEIICHGTPSPKVFRKYLQEILNENEKFINTNFRDKINGWKNALTTTTTTRAFSIPACEDVFMRVFLENLCLRPSCGECKFNKLPRQADLTIGDFWGIGKYSKKLNDKKGTSVVLVNNEKGKKLLKSVEKDLKILEKVPLKYAINGNHNIVGASVVNPKRKTFMKNFGIMSLADCLKNCYDNSCDFLIVNFWDSSNYGAILTAYAMQELIKGFGYRTKILKDNEQVANRKFQTSVFQKFANQFLDITTQLSYKRANTLTKSLKGIIVGSDQVFRPRYIGKSSNKFLLNFADKDCRKLAISASFGIDKKEYPNSTSFKRLYKKAKKSLRSFDFLSCREFSGTEIYKDIFGLNSDVIIDPVFLIAKEQYDEILKVSNVDYTDKVVSYILDYNEEYYDFEKRFGIDAVKLNNSEEPVNVEDWVNAIKSCKFLITDSFHGACFAIIFNKPFICLTNKSRGIARFDTLRELTGIEKNFVSSLNDVESLSENIDYNAVNIVLNREKERCLALLEQVIKNDYSNNECKREYVYNKKFNLRKYSEYVFYRTLRLFIKTQKIKDKIANAKYAIDWRS